MLTLMFKMLKEKFEEHPFRTTAEIIGMFLANVGVAVLIIWMIYLGIVGSGQPPQCPASAPSSDNSSITGGAGSWTKPGTRNYNGAKALFSALKSKGVNDTQASGVVGALAHEAGGAFGVPDIAQGFYTWTSNPTEENAGISSPGVASKAEHASGGERLTGASMFQYTPFTKYAPASNKAKWRSYPDLISYWFKTQVPGQGQSISGLRHCGSISSAVHWTLQVEEGGGSNDAFSDRLAKAHQAYKAFSGVGGTAGDVDTGSASGTSKCNSSSGAGNADTKDLQVAEKYAGLKYSQSSRYQSIKDIEEGKPKSETAENDCDGFVYAVLRRINAQGIPSHYWGNVQGVQDSMKKYRIPLKDVRPGDFGIYPDGAKDGSRLGHAFFFDSSYKGSNTVLYSEGPSEVARHNFAWELTGGVPSEMIAYRVPGE